MQKCTQVSINTPALLTRCKHCDCCSRTMCLCEIHVCRKYLRIKQQTVIIHLIKELASHMHSMTGVDIYTYMPPGFSASLPLPPLHTSPPLMPPWDETFRAGHPILNYHRQLPPAAGSYQQLLSRLLFTRTNPLKLTPHVVSAPMWPQSPRNN